MRRSIWLSAGIFSFFAASAGLAQSPRTLYTWSGTGDVRGWVQAFGDNVVTIENAVDGELTITESGGSGATVAIADDGNIIAEGGPSQGGLDVTGLSALELELGHNGAGPVTVQFYVQAAPSFDFVGLGADQDIAPGVATYTAPLDGLTPAQAAYIRVIGINIRDHAEEGDLVWTLREVRSAGEPLDERFFATHEADSSDSGLQGAFVNFENAAVMGNDGGQNQTGLSLNTTDTPPGNTGSLQWTDLAGHNGGAITWVNGTVFNGNSFNERPTDMSNYEKVVVRMAATNVEGGLVESVGVQYFIQSANFQFHQAGAIENLPADGEFHDVEFLLAAVPRLDFVDTHGINLQEHAGGDLVIDIDSLRAVAPSTITDCNHNGIDDGRDLVDGTSKDCNENLGPDECDVSSGISEDCNQNAIPDECEITGGERTRLLYTWQGVGDPRGWFKAFGTNDLVIDNDTDGSLTVTEIGAEGSFSAVSDDFNIIAEGVDSTGGLDLTGMSTLEVDVGHNGTAPVQVQFYVQASPAFTYVALGPDVAVGPEVATYTLPLDGLAAAEITYLRTIGLNFREHTSEGNLVWTIEEVRAIGVPLSQRDFATHEPGSSDQGLQGAAVAFDNAAVEGNDGQQNQTGLRHNTGAAPPGNTGSLQWTDLAELNGGAINWFNGTVFQGNSFNERPADMSPYSEIVTRLAATNVTPGAVDSVDVQYFLQTGNFNFFAAGPPQTLPADGKFHDLIWPIDGIPDRTYVDAHGIDLQEHASGALVMDVDRIRAIGRASTLNDCNANRIPDSCDIASGVLHDADQNGFPDECTPAATFRRGDSNADGGVNISDAVSTLGCLFLGAACTLCPDSADADDSGNIDLSDAVYTLNNLFLGGPPLPAPGPDGCGTDPTEDDLEPCQYLNALCG